MSLTEILAEIPKLSFSERQELVRRATAPEDKEELTPEETAILDQRLGDFRHDPSAGISAEELKRTVLSRIQAMIREIIVRPLAVEDIDRRA